MLLFELKSFNKEIKMIEKKFVKLGRSWGLIIPPVILQLLKINPEKETVNISIDNEKIIIEKRKFNE